VMQLHVCTFQNQRKSIKHTACVPLDSFVHECGECFQHAKKAKALCYKLEGRGFETR
jgi:hypothetical protein